MIKITVCFAVLMLGIFLSVQGQTRRPEPRENCRRQNERCVSRESRNGRTNDVTTIFNNHCRQNNRNWRNVTRCELARANCHLTLVNCSPLTCANVRRSLSGGGHPPDPATTTRGGRPRPTTRRTPTTRRFGPPTTRRTRRTTFAIPETRPPNDD